METQQILDLALLIETIRLTKEQRDKVLDLIKGGIENADESLALTVNGSVISFVHLTDKEVNKIMACFVDVSNLKIKEAKKHMVDIMYPVEQSAPAM
jgi:hypothetical protein